VALSDATGQIVERYRYDVFGRVEIRSATGESVPVSLFGNRFLFTGREHLSDVGLYDYRNRVYSAELGRFLQTDPIRFSAGDGNLYRYVGNDPINLWDPWGLCGDSYGDLNFSFNLPVAFGFGPGVQFGLAFNQTGLHPYLGWSFGTSGPYGHFHAVNGSPTTGWGSMTVSGGAVVGGQYTPSSGSWGIGMSSPGVGAGQVFTW
jgi:RHS repeat-associated protein